MPPESIGNTVRHYREKLDSFSNSSEAIYSSIENRYKSIFHSQNRIQEYEDELQNISDKISGKDNMCQYEQELADIKSRLREIQVKKDRLNQDDGAQKNIIEQCKKLYDKLATVSQKNKQAIEQLKYAETIKDWLSETYKQYEIAIREKLERKVNEIFERMYHGHRRVVIDEKYNVELVINPKPPKPYRPPKDEETIIVNEVAESALRLDEARKITLSGDVESAFLIGVIEMEYWIQVTAACECTKISPADYQSKVRKRKNRSFFRTAFSFLIDNHAIIR